MPGRAHPRGPIVAEFARIPLANDAEFWRIPLPPPENLAGSALGPMAELPSEATVARVAAACGPLTQPAAEQHCSLDSDPSAGCPVQVTATGMGASRSNDQGTAWMDRNQPSDPELLRFRSEATAALGLPSERQPDR
jgi:hypothetical protein